ncbi:MAG: GNAT family N-acetyltransferase [Candidatus Thiodiazotropha sp.]
MNIEFEYSDRRGIDWRGLSELYRRAPLGVKSAEDLETVFGNSRYCCFVYADGHLIGAGRVLADGVDCAYICDVALLPEYQGRGIGSKIVSDLVERSRGHKKIVLYSVPGREAFYKKLGFMRMNTAMAIFRDQEQTLASGLLSEP